MRELLIERKVEGENDIRALEEEGHEENGGGGMKKEWQVESGEGDNWESGDK